MVSRPRQDLYDTVSLPLSHSISLQPCQEANSSTVYFLLRVTTHPQGSVANVL